jgi:hypothetical protein
MQMLRDYVCLEYLCHGGLGVCHPRLHSLVPLDDMNILSIQSNSSFIPVARKTDAL